MRARDSERMKSKKNEIRCSRTGMMVERASSLKPVVSHIQYTITTLCSYDRRLLIAMGSMTPEMRCKVPVKYKEMFGKQLKDVMKSEAGKRDFGTALQLLSSPPDQAECGMIYRAVGGLGTN